MRSYALGLTALSLLTCAGCSITRPEAARVEKLLPPSQLLADCRTPALRDSTTQGLVDLAIDQAGALRDCTADKAALRSWAQEVAKSE